MKRAVMLSITEDLAEMQGLLHTLEISVEKVFVQRRSEPHRNTYLGSGRIEEIEEEVRDLEIDYIVVNGNLKPSQHHAIEMLFQKECLDRVGVILRIFSEHAHTEEAKNQVTLATLRYELPFLREWIHKAKSGERPGFLSGGAYATEVYYEHAKSHIRRIEERLQNRSDQREVRRTRRRKQGYFLVSIAGYTNAGKSALLNALSDSQQLVEDKLFSTLSTTTRRLRESKRNILLTDTVGFIGGLPEDLVDAFNSTLEEIFLADLVLLVVDVSETQDVIRKKLTTSVGILAPKLNGKEMVIVGSKVDSVLSSERDAIMKVLKDVAPASDVTLASSFDGAGLDVLVRIIEERDGRSFVLHAKMPISDGTMSLISELHDISDVTTKETDENIELTLVCRPCETDRIAGKIRAVGGILVTSR